MDAMIKLNLDGRDITAKPEQTLLEVAREHEIFIPTLCHFAGLASIGACRMCLVEVKGVPRLLPACVTKVAEGMQVTTDSPKLQAYRLMILELLFSERNHVCAACVANGHCELQYLAQRLGMHHTRFPYRYPDHQVDASHPRFVSDPNRCILCTRCVRVCDEVEGARTWNIMGRGIRSEVITDLHQPWGESSTCTSCSKCVQVCPTGALYEKGKSAGERVQRVNVLPYLSSMRHNRR